MVKLVATCHRLRLRFGDLHEFGIDHDVKAPLAQRLNASGYPATLAVENVSAGYHTLAEAFSGWRDSPPHRANMLKNGVTKLGIAASYAPNTKYKVFWTLILASSEPR